MTRQSSTLILSLIVLAAALAPVSAFADGYQSVSAIVGPTQSANDDDYSSVNALVGDLPSDRSTLSSPQNPAGSLNAIVGADGVPAPSSQPVDTSDDDDGLNWSDVGIGALMAAGLGLITLAAAVLVARHRRTTVESRA